MTTRRKAIEIVGAAAASVAFPGIAAAQGLKTDRRKALDHVVVVMFENRSFDNLLGRLYAPGEVKSFEGVIGKNLSNPIPEWAEDRGDKKIVPYGVARTMNTPPWDPGEEYNSVNTQLFGIQDPDNRGRLRGLKTYNTPPAGSRPRKPSWPASDRRRG